MRISQRWVLVLLLSAGQFLCLALAVLLFSDLVEGSTRQIVRKRVIQASEQFAVQAVELIRAIGLTDLSPGSEDWRRLQQVVASTGLPNEGFLCVVDSTDGTVICHPELADRPELADTSLGELVLHDPEGETRLLDAVSSPEARTSTGWVETADGIYLVAVHTAPELGAAVLAYQCEEPINVAIGRFIALFRATGLGVTIALAVLLALVSWLIVRRYENRLAHINENLEAIVEKRSKALLQSRSAVILGLATLAESRDDETGRHLHRISRYVRILCRELLKNRSLGRLDEELLETMVETSALHDIGKVGVPDSVLLKPGKLTDEERRIIQRHPLIGGDTLLAVKQQWSEDKFLITACEIAFSHHERWDGKGYPFGLAGDMIPLAGRIVALADVYDALTTPRVYKSAVEHEEAKRIIVEGSGAHFDSRVVDAFLASEDKFRAVLDELGEAESHDG